MSTLEEVRAALEAERVEIVRQRGFIKAAQTQGEKAEAAHEVTVATLDALECQEPSAPVPAPYISHDFADGTLGPLVASTGSVGSVTVQGGAAVCSAPGRGPGTSQIAELRYSYTPNQPPNEPGGLYQRWSVTMDQETLDALATGQMKLLLNRADTNPPSWLAMVFGGGIEAPGDELVVVRDADSGFISGQSITGYHIQPDQVVVFETHYVRADGVGRARLWIDGTLYIDHTHAALGTDDLTRQMTWGIGLTYGQDNVARKTMTVRVSDVEARAGEP